jgi:hypothetical protein
MENQEQLVRPFGRVVAMESFEIDPKDSFMSLPSGPNVRYDPPDFAGIGLM